MSLAAADPRRKTLRPELLEADAPLVVTLGQEALAALRKVADLVSGVPAVLAPDGHGGVGELRSKAR